MVVEIDIDDDKQILKLGCFKTVKVAHQCNCLMDNLYLVETLATDPSTSPNAVIYIISSIRTMSSVELIQNAINFLRKLE